MHRQFCDIPVGKVLTSLEKGIQSPLIMRKDYKCGGYQDLQKIVSRPRPHFRINSIKMMSEVSFFGEQTLKNP